MRHHTHTPQKPFSALAFIKRSPRATGAALALIVISALLAAGAFYRQKNEEAARQERIQQTLKENAKTVRFVENKGQFPNKDVLYYFDAKQGSVYIERDQIRFVAKETEERPAESISAPGAKKPLFKPGKDHIVKAEHSFTLRLDGSNPSPNIRRGEEFGTRYNYFLGTDSSKWVTGVRAAKELTLEDVYPGVDLRLYSTNDGSLEFDWVMDAGADFSHVKMSFEGQDSLSVDQDGSLKVGLRFTDVKFHLPESYQVTDKGKAPVNVAFNKSDSNTVAFTAESQIDQRYPLVIDPTLSWGTYMDGNSSSFDAYLFAIQVDSADGMVYCAGYTNINIPTGSAPYDANGYLNTISNVSGSRSAAVVYRISSTGADLVDLTLYGPSSLNSNSEDVRAYALSLSPNNVFVGGFTTVDIPTAGTPFDSSRSSGDGFVAVFSRDLGTLSYATYLGGSGSETRGVTSIRALSDSSFVVGLTVEGGALPTISPNYLPGTPADSTFDGDSNNNDEMYIAKFGTINTLSWGTYVGGNSDDTFNDLEVFADGRVAFAGYGSSSITEVGSAAASGSNEDGIIGVINTTGTSFNYLDKIGGSNNDRINDVEIVGSTLYWSGSAGSGFPTSAGAYDTAHNGNMDAVIGSVADTGGAASYKATFYGTSSNDLGSGLKLVTQTSCTGQTSTFILVFGVVGGTGLPTQNVNSEPFFRSTYTSGGFSGYDMFFAGFSDDLTSLIYGTYIGGNQDDYLGETGDPRGANHLWVNGANIYCGTTTHSASHNPTIVSGGFDTSKSNSAGNDDSHVIFSIVASSLTVKDFSDAPASYGAPAHALNCTQLRIGALLDDETAALPTAAANGDDNDNLDDEDGIVSLPSISTGGPQNISITVSNILNTTGSTANLYAWIDLDSDGNFEASEIQTTTVPSGGTVNRTLNWTGVTFSGAAPYVRIRLTTDSLTDTVGTANVDERSTVAATNGEVEDYLMTVVQVADLSVTKTDGTGTYTPGSSTTYTIVVSNAGPATANGVVVTDNIPAQISSWTWVCSGATGGATGCTPAASNSSNFTDTVNLPANSSITYTVTANISAGATGSLVNTVTAAPPTGMMDPTPATATDTDTSAPVADLTVTKTDGVGTYTAGNSTTYTIVVSNAGPSNASGVTVTDNIPAQISSWTWVCSGATGGATGCTPAASNSSNFTDTVDIPAGGSITYTVTANISAGATGNLVNTVTATPPVGTTDPTPATATDTDTPAPQADLTVTKTDGVGTYTAGNSTTYTIVVSNAGPSNASGVTVTDNIPAQISSWTWVCSGATGGATGCTPAASNSSNFTDTVDIPAGGSITYTVTANISAGATGSLVNTVTATPPVGTTDPTPATATDTDTPAPQADLTVTKTDGVGTYTAGNSTTYTIVVSNAGPSNASGVTVTDNKPSQISSWTWVCSGATGGATGCTPAASNSSNFTDTVDIPAGGSITYTVTANISAGATGNLVNTVTATPPVGTTDPTPATATDTDTPAPQADLTVTKTDGVGTYTAGNSTTYTIVVSNAGPSNASGVTVTDNKPSQISSWTWVCSGATGGATGCTPAASNSSNFTDTVDIPAGGSITYTVTANISAGATGNLVNTVTATPPVGTTDPTPATATDTDTPAPQADLTVTKTDGVGTYTAGNSTIYTIVVSNAGPSNASGVTVTDNIPAQISSWTWVCSGATGGATGCTPAASNSSNFTDTVDIPAGGSITYTVTANISAGATGNLVNTVTATPPVGTTDPTPATATDTDTPAPQADLSVTKTDGVTTYTAGNSTTYTIVVSNAGPSNASGVTVTDNIPAQVSSWTWVCSGATGGATGCTPAASNSSNFTDTVDIPAGGSITYTVTANISAGATGSLVNTVTATPPVGTTDPTPATATDTDTPAPQADLTVTKTDGVGTYTAGTSTTYTIVVSNAGPSDANGVTVTDNKPSQVSSWTWVCSGATGGATGCTPAASNSSNFTDTVNLPANSSITYTVTANISAGATGNLVNTVTATPPVGTTDPTPATATDTDTASPVADLAVQKNGPATVAANGTVVYTIRVSNVGPSAANGAAVTDPFPGVLTSVSWVCDSETGGAVCGTTSGTGNLNTTVATFPPGGSVTYTVTGTAPASGTFTNTATVAPPQGVTDPNPSNNTSSVTTGVGVVPTTADLAVVKSGPSTVAPNGTVNYQIVVTNAGPGAANGATVTDTVPLTGVTWTCGLETAGASCGTANGSGNINTTITTFPAGASVTFMVTGTAPASGQITNTATVAPPSGVTDPNTSNNTSSVTTTVQTPTTTADLYAIKTGPATVGPNATVTYMVIVGNSGPSGVTNASFSDNVPSALTGVTWTCGSPTGGASCGTTNGSGNAISTTIASLPSSGTVTFTITGTGPSSGSFVNSATITPPTGTNDPDPTDNIGGPVITNVVVEADLSVTKTDGVATYTPGSLTTYTIVVTNNGPDGVTGAVVTDNIPAQVTSWAWTCSGATGGATGCTPAASNSSNFTDTVNLPAGSSITYTVVAQTSPSATGNLVNTVTTAVPAGVTDPTPGNNSATDTDAAALVADLSVTKTDGVGTYTAGNSTTYTIVVSNAGPSDANGAVVTDNKPAQVSSWTWTCSGATGGATGCNGVTNSASNFTDTVNLPAGSSITYTVVAQTSSSATGNLVNTVTAAPPVGTTDPTPATATDTDTPAPQADLTVTKTDGVGTYTAGNSTTYTIVVSNTGPSDANGAVVTDNKPAQVSSWTWTCSGATGGATGCNGVTNSASNFTDTVNLPAGSSITYTVVAQTSSSATGNLVNTVTAAPPVGTTDPTPATATDTDTPAPQADLSVTKTDGVGTYAPGNSTTYTIVVSNAGPSDANGVTVTDNIPSQVTSWAWTCSGATGGATGCTPAASNSSNFTDTVNIPAGGSITYTVVAQTSPSATGNLVNTVTAAPPVGTTDPTPATATDTDTASPVADLSVTKTDGVGTYTAGNSTTYTIVVSNAGPSDANGVTVTDNIPSQVSSWAWTCSGATGGATGCTPAASNSSNFSDTVNLPAGSSITYTVVAQTSPSATGNLVNTVTAAPPTGTTDPTPATATDTDTAAPKADLAVTKTNNTTSVTSGGTTTYTIVVTNNGPSNASGVTVSDPKPSQISSWTWTCSGSTGGATGCDSVTNSSADFTDTINLPAGATITYTVTANISASANGTLVNTVTVTPPNGTTDPTPGNNSATDTDSVVSQADLAITKTASNLTPKLGDTVTFTITIRNNGPGSASGVKVEDILQAGLIFTSASASQGSYSSVTGVWTVGSLNANASATLTIRVRIEFGCCTVANIARIIESSVPDPNTGNNQASVTIGAPVGPGGNLPSSSELSDDKAGSVLIYNFYTSSVSQSSQNTRFNLTNTSPNSPIAVHLFFVDGASCSVADMFLCLTPNQTSSFLASDLDPGTTGYLIAVAVDCVTGCPVNFNCLIGDAYVKLSSGHQANLSAESVSSLIANPAACNENSNSATLNFDGLSYGRLPRALAVDNLGSRVDGNDTLLVINRIGGSLATGASTLTGIFGILYNDQETPLSFSFSPGLCQFRSSLGNSFPRTTPRYDTFIPGGRTGWMKFWSLNDQAILGSAINFNPNVDANSGAYNQGRNLHKLTLTSGATLVIPVFPPPCC